MKFTPYNWYWLASDGRVFSSATQSVTQTSDAAYQEWIASGKMATPWPQDNSGAQTAAALQDVLTPYGLFASLANYAANARWIKEIGGITVAGVAVATDDRSKELIMGVRIAASADGTFTTPWVGADGTIVTLNATQVIAISNAVLAHVQACFATFATVQSQISANTITTRAQVDAAFA